MTKVVALVPMRHHSQRVPGKNFRPMGGKPLFHYIVETLLDVPEISTVVVDTDSPDITMGLETHFPTVKVIQRPEFLAADETPMNEVLFYDTSQVDSEFYLQTHSTNPLLKAGTISKAIQSLLKNYPAYDSLFSVTRWQTRIWDRHGQAINHNPDVLLQTQDLPPIYEENSCIYIFNRETLVRRRNRLGERPMMFEVEAEEAWDIDEELDFTITDYLIKIRKNQ
jgi:CMP-N-acetylneuraminic acid synthetase